MLIKVRVTPESKSDLVIKKSEDLYLVKVREKATGGTANRKTKQMLAEYFKVTEGKIRLIKGGKRPNKIFNVNNSVLNG